MLFKGQKRNFGLVLFGIVLVAISLSVLSLRGAASSEPRQSGESRILCSTIGRSLGPADPIGDALLSAMSYFCPKGPAATEWRGESIRPTLVQIIYTGRWSPPSPDPAGIVYMPATGHLLISDSEVDEIPSLFTGRNVFEFASDGTLLHTYSTISYSNEPTGITLNPTNAHIFISDDDTNDIFEIAPGPDGKYWTADDLVTSFNVAGFGVIDAEDVAYGHGKLFIADGQNREVWIISPGPNGRFDGPPPNGDDTASHFDTAILGVDNPEGIAYSPDTGNIWLCSKKSPIVEVTMTGTLVRSFDISFVNPHGPDAILLAPGSNKTSEIHLWVADRMIDNNHDPNENDGRIFEFDIGKSPAFTPSRGSPPAIISGFPPEFAWMTGAIAAAIHPGSHERD